MAYKDAIRKEKQMFMCYLYNPGPDYSYITIDVCECDGGGFPWYHPSECVFMIPRNDWNCD